MNLAKLNLRKLGILISIIVAVAVTLSIVFIPKLFEDYSGTLSLISLLVAIFMFFYQLDLEKRMKVEELHDVIRRYCNAIQRDVAEIKKEIMSEDYEKVTSKKGKTSTTVFLSTKIYDTLIYSGNIIHFQPDTQSNLDNLYYKIERNNDNIRRRTEAIISRQSIANSADESNIAQVIDNFNELIGVYHEEIVTLLVKVEENIKVELGLLK